MVGEGSGVGVGGSEMISSMLQSPVSEFTPNSHCGCDRAKRLGSTGDVGEVGVGVGPGVGIGVEEDEHSSIVDTTVAPSGQII